MMSALLKYATARATSHPGAVEIFARRVEQPAVAFGNRRKQQRRFAAVKRDARIVVCANCGARFAQGVKFCGKCGNRSFNVLSEGEDKQGFPCPRCSAMLPQFSKFCGRCGLNMTQSGNLPKSQPIGFHSNYPLKVPPQVEKICGDAAGSFRRISNSAGAAEISELNFHKFVLPELPRCKISYNNYRFSSSMKFIQE
jgi:ribosomal protein L40E